MDLIQEWQGIAAIYSPKNNSYLYYCWWTKSCTTKDDDYPIIYRVLTIPGGAGFLPSTVVGGWVPNPSEKQVFVKMGESLPQISGCKFKNSWVATSQFIMYLSFGSETWRTIHDYLFQQIPNKVVSENPTVGGYNPGRHLASISSKGVTATIFAKT